MMSSPRAAELAITRDAILEAARQIPSAPQVLAGLGELLQDVNTDLEQIAAEIRHDPALAARVIKISNSAALGGGQRVGSVDEAVNRVGFSEVMRLVGAATVAGMVDRALACYGVPAERLRESLLLHALASEAVAELTTIDSRAAYCAGLLRAIGMMVLDRAGRGRVAPATAYDGKQFSGYWQWEAARFGVGSIEATTMVLDDWRFPPETVAALQEHLLLSEAGYQDPFAVVLNLAGAIVAEHDLALPGETMCWTLTAEKLGALGIDEEQFRSAGERAKAVFERQRAALY
jgi:HD-like signal output (HDOD) protein